MLRLTSPAFEDGQEIAQKFGKRAQNISPPLQWDGVPDRTRSFALTVVDLHPVARGYVHWLVADLSPQLSSLPEGAAGARTITSSSCTRSGPIGSASGPERRWRNSGRLQNKTRWPRPL